MKTQVTKPGFTPIIITLETEEEASLLVHVFNCARTMSFGDYSIKHKIGDQSKLHHAIWNQLDKAHPIKYIDRGINK